MMTPSYIHYLKISALRSHPTGRYEFNPHVNAIVGLNGSGKTTLVEAIYALTIGSSFRGPLRDMMQWGEDSTSLELTYRNNTRSTTRRLVLQQKEDAISKQWNVDDKKSARLPLNMRLPIVLFEPDIGRMVSGSPQRRRDYIDMITGQTSFEAAKAQAQFERILRQRNTLLKQIGHHTISKNHHDQLFIWNTQLATASEVIVSSRVKLIKSLQSNISAQYHKLGGSDNISLSYQSSVSDDPKQYASRLLNFLDSSLTRDLIIGHTSFGPHRDDINIMLADQPAKDRASRGEITTIVLTLKLLEAELLRESCERKNIMPTLLFDDVLSELDLHHQAQILAGFNDYQVFITTTDAHTLTPGTHTIAL